jgi:hypothetical protein
MDITVDSSGWALPVRFLQSTGVVVRASAGNIRPDIVRQIIIVLIFVIVFFMRVFWPAAFENTLFNKFQ